MRGKNKLLHIQGYGRDISICDALSDNYNLDIYFDSDEETECTIDNIILKIYSSDSKCSLEDVEENNIRKMLGDILVTGQEYGYSEYTIEGFNVNSAKLGGHNIQDIIDGYNDKYLHITIERANNERQEN